MCGRSQSLPDLSVQRDYSLLWVSSFWTGWNSRRGPVSTQEYCHSLCSPSSRDLAVTDPSEKYGGDSRTKGEVVPDDPLTVVVLCWFSWPRGTFTLKPNVIINVKSSPISVGLHSLLVQERDGTLSTNSIFFVIKTFPSFTYVDVIEKRWECKGCNLFW